MSVWSVQTLSVWPFFSTPGPTQPIHVVAISGWMPPWFHANVWFGGVVFGRNTHWSRAVFAHGVVDEALRKKSPWANGVNDGVRAGSAVTMWSNFSSTGSAIATKSLFFWPFSGSVTFMSDIAFSSVRAVAESRAGLPVM